MKDFAFKITKEAADYLLENFKRDETLIARRMMAKEIVTEFDRKNDSFFVEKISENFPDHNILTEESGFIDRKSKYTWIVDPLDGTSNYATGNPFFSVSLAIAKNNEIIFGIINAPFLGEIFTSEKGKGAFLNGKRIKVSEVNEIKKSYFLSCQGGDSDNKRIAKINSVIYSISKDLKKLGSGAIEGAYIACGRADAFISIQLAPWDIAAAALILREAGGRITDFDGNEWTPKKSSVILSNGKIHSKTIELIKKSLS